MKVREIDPFWLSIFSAETTGIEQKIWLCTEGSKIYPKPIVFVGNDMSAAICVDEPYKVIQGELTKILLQQVISFVQRNRNVIIQYWYSQIDTALLCKRLRPVRFVSPKLNVVILNLQVKDLSAQYGYQTSKMLRWAQHDTFQLSS